MPDYSTYQRPYRRRRRRMFNQKLFIYILAAFVCIASISSIMLFYFLPNNQMEPPFEHIKNMQEGVIGLVYQDQVLPMEHPPMLVEDQIYLPVDFLQEYVDPYIFWEGASNRLTITTLEATTVITPGETEYTVNRKPETLPSPVLLQNDTAYMPQSFLEERYVNFTFTYDDVFQMVIAENKTENKTTAPVLKKTRLRYGADIKSPVAFHVDKDVDVTVFEEVEKFTKVRLPNGLVGYIQTKALGEKTEIPAVPVPLDAAAPPIWAKDGKLVVVWEAMSVKLNKAAAVPGADVVSPTWFEFNADNLDSPGQAIADIDSLGSVEYVQDAHAKGLKVWALISDNFNSAVSHAVLSDPLNRDHMIEQLMGYISLYDLDGINIDFEAVTEADAPYFVQFIRELGPLMKEREVVLSVDLYVPMYTKHYNRKEIAKVADYICVMAYDEHYSGSSNTGPVASLGFVDNGIAQTLEEVPKSKILMGLPFYVRVWTEWQQDGVLTFSKQDLSMQGAYNLFTKNNATFTWLPDIGSYYGEYQTTENGRDVVKKVWLEDERSIEGKLGIANAYDVAGLACWRYGLEKPEVWTAINQYTGQQ